MLRCRRMFVLILMVAGRVLNAQWADHVVISEIRYDEGNDVNEEFVELYNPTEEDVSLEGWKLMYKSKTGTTWYTKETFTSEHTIPAHGFFLWGGSDLSVTADVEETSQSALGLANSGGHIAVHDAADAVVDLVAWEGGDSPEGGGDAGKTEDGGSLERKASAGSTAESMATGGDEAEAGNGYDTDDNAADFIVHDADEVHPQNCISPPEPSTAVEDAGTAVVPNVFRLYPNYPNPFNGSTVVAYSLPREGSVKLAVYDVTGRQVRVLGEGRQAPGRHSRVWTGDDEEGRILPSGVYLNRLECGSLIQIRKMVFVR